MKIGIFDSGLKDLIANINRLTQKLFAGKIELERVNLKDGKKYFGIKDLEKL